MTLGFLGLSLVGRGRTAHRHILVTHATIQAVARSKKCWPAGALPIPAKGNRCRTDRVSILRSPHVQSGSRGPEVPEPLPFGDVDGQGVPVSLPDPWPLR